MADIQNPVVQKLFEQVQQFYTMPLQVKVTGHASEVLAHDQSNERLLADGSVEVAVTDTTNVDYTLSHELVHMLLTGQGYPQLQFKLNTGDPNLDTQCYAVGTSLFSAVIHYLVVQWQDEHGLIDDTVKSQVDTGFAKAVKPETRNSANLIVYRILSLFDHMVFHHGGSDAQQAKWRTTYPQAFGPAKALYEQLMTRPPKDPFSFRRALVNIFARFGGLLEQLGYQALPLAEFATVPPVLSERQLRLHLNQVFTLKHSEYRNADTKELAYVALGDSDDQNAFVLPLKAPSPEFFKAFYQRPLQDILKEYEIDFTVRS